MLGVERWEGVRRVVILISSKCKEPLDVNHGIGLGFIIDFVQSFAGNDMTDDVCEVGRGYIGKACGMCAAEDFKLRDQMNF